jgi:ABC-2 type transport system ATP-binding protein
MNPPVVLEATGLTKRYGPVLAVDDLSLSVQQGEIFGLLGPNGAGKTTTISLLCGWLKPDRGQVRILGKSLLDGDVRSRIGVCPQEIALWSHLTCLEQLVLVGELYDVRRSTARERGQQLLVDLGLIDKRDQQARTLSGGMQRRLNLALALVHDPDIVVLDEPEAGLDPQSRVAVRAFIRGIARRKTVILTTHNMDEADRLADRIAIVDAGRLLVLDTPESLKRRIGAGDVLEIAVDEDPGCRQRASDVLGSLDGPLQARFEEDRLQVRALDVAGRIPQIIETLRAAGLTIGDLRLRGNTLEDVFLQLTGRRLRE